jgi:PBS lyase HEAT-like repeat
MIAGTVLKNVVILTAAALLLGSGICRAQSLVFNETTPDFGAMLQGKPSVQKTISVSNESDAPFLFQQIVATRDFSQTNNCPTWLLEGSGCLIAITFTPTVGGLRTGELVVVLGEAGEYSIPLKGFGLPSVDAQSEIVNVQSHTERTRNGEEEAQHLINDKRYKLQKLLDKNAADIANSEKVFALTRDTERKERIASILVSLGVKDPSYFDYLSAQAKKALAHDRDMPWPSLYDGNGDSTSPNPAFIEWCDKHQLPFWDMYRVSYYELPAAWYFLAAAGDPRSYDLLISGLHSFNLMIVATAARGLAKLQDPRAVDELIATGSHVPGEALLGIAQSLIYFSAPKAQMAAEKLTSEKEKRVLEAYRQDMNARGLKALFPW